jgi:hypothetical protein
VLLFRSRFRFRNSPNSWVFHEGLIHEQSRPLAESRSGQQYANRGQLLIEAQQRIVEALTAGGAETTLAEETLEAFEQSQGRLLRQIDALLDALDKAPLTDSTRKS